MGHWWLLSFVDRHAPQGQRFRGIMVVEVERDSSISAALAAAARWPEVEGWDLQGVPVPVQLVPPAHFRNRFMSTAAADQEEAALVRQHITHTAERMAEALPLEKRQALAAMGNDQGIASCDPESGLFCLLSFPTFGGFELRALQEDGLVLCERAPVLPTMLKPMITVMEDVPLTHVWRHTSLGRHVFGGLEQVERKRMLAQVGMPVPGRQNAV